jgi:uncharacterized protein (TIGR03067 family)
MKAVGICLVIYFMGFFVAQAEDSIIGTWQGIYHDGNKAVYQFHPDNTVIWTVTDATTKKEVTLHCLYKFDPTKQPNQFEIYQAGIPGLQTLRFLGIIKFSGKDTLSMVVLPTKDSNDLKRPTSFDINSFDLKKIDN